MSNLYKFLDKNKIEYSIESEVLEKNSEDTSLFKMRPEIVVFPRNKREISTLLNFINNEDGYNLVSRSGGTDMSGGVLGNSIILSFTKYFNDIKYVDKSSLQAEVEPGVFYRDFEFEAKKYNLLLPSYPASKDICTIGGMVSNNSGGEKSLVYGKTENYVLEIECVLSNGEVATLREMELDKLRDIVFDTKDESFKNTLLYSIYRGIYQLVTDDKCLEIIKRNKPIVSKNSAGYYLWNLLSEKDGIRYVNLANVIVGSQGTLSIVTSVKLKLVKEKKHQKMMLVFLKDIRDLSIVQNIILKSNPESFESYDNHTFKVAIKFLPSFIKTIISNKKEGIGIFSFLRLIFSFWREAKLLIFFGIPKLFLIAEFAGDDISEIDNRVDSCIRELDKYKNKIKTQKIDSKIEVEKYWTLRRESFNLLRQKVKNLHTAPFIDDVIVPVKDLGEFLDELVKILKENNLLYTIAGHVGDGNLHIIPLMDFSNTEKVDKNIQTIKSVAPLVYSLVKKYKGSITAEHNDGLIRTPFLNQVFDDEMLNLFKKVKNIFDPKNILNPGKKVPKSDDLKTEFENNLSNIKYN